MWTRQLVWASVPCSATLPEAVNDALPHAAKAPSASTEECDFRHFHEVLVFQRAVLECIRCMRMQGCEVSILEWVEPMSGVVIQGCSRAHFRSGPNDDVLCFSVSALLDTTVRDS